MASGSFFWLGLCHHGFLLGERTVEVLEEGCLLDHRSQLARVASYLQKIPVSPYLRKPLSVSEAGALLSVACAVECWASLAESWFGWGVASLVD